MLTWEKWHWRGTPFSQKWMAIKKKDIDRKVSLLSGVWDFEIWASLLIPHFSEYPILSNGQLALLSLFFLWIGLVYRGSDPILQIKLHYLWLQSVYRFLLTSMNIRGSCSRKNRHTPRVDITKMWLSTSSTRCTQIVNCATWIRRVTFVNFSSLSRFFFFVGVTFVFVFFLFG